MDPTTGHHDSSPSKSPEPTEFALAKADEDDPGAPEREGADGVQVLAADYDPSLDRREDEQKRFRDIVRPKDEPINEEEAEEEVEEDVDDMFAIAMGDKKPRKVTKVLVSPFSMFNEPGTQHLRRRRTQLHLP